MTIRAGVAGQPISHSLSPLLHGLWIEAAGLDATYEAFGPDDADGFAHLIAEGRAGRLRGLNVTSPFKEQALAAADEVSAIARACGSANRLVFENGRVFADSTDGRGLMLALSEQAPNFDPKGAKVVVLGAGGAARAAVVALKAAGAEVAVLNRTRAKAEALSAELGSTVATPDEVRDAALIINALSVRPDVDVASLRSDAVLMDMTYKPLVTPFLAAGRARGLTTVDGLAMLIGQAVPSFRAFFGVEPPPVDVRAAALARLGETA